MAKRRRWTVVFVPHDAEPSRIMEVSYRVVKTAIGGAVMAAAAALVLGYMTVSRTVDLSKSARLTQENTRLEQQLDELNGRLATLADTLSAGNFTLSAGLRFDLQRGRNLEARSLANEMF